MCDLLDTTLLESARLGPFQNNEASMDWQIISLASLAFSGVIAITSLWWIKSRSKASQKDLDRQLTIIQEQLKHITGQKEQIQQLFQAQQEHQHQQRERFDEHQLKTLKLLQDSLQKGLTDARSQITDALTQHSNNLTERVEKLTQETSQRLKEISGEVDKQLKAGFEKTTATFGDVMKRLTIIDEAQKKITELSGNVVSLQEVLADRKSRGAFGEVQLNSLIRNILPESNFSLQHTLSNSKRVDCLLLLPEPTGNIAIDAKFPLESYRLLSNKNISDSQRRQAEQQFRLDIRKHIQDIAAKYILPGETADGAVMFIPAEAIFAEIHANYAELVESAHQARVWMVSPTTMMAILTTASAVLKDAATRKQVHIIQEHLVALSKDFSRFQKRMDNLAKHIDQAQQDVEQVHRSSQKITSRFSKIENVELPEEEKSLIT